jgi:pimeloyl-ACP methyl ester carboxylesterase
VPKIRVRELEMYYEIHGRSDAEPLVLLHGFTGTGEETFEPYFEKLGKYYRLFVPDLRGHGRTTNPSGEIHHADFARDIAAFANALKLDRAHYCGHSSGGMLLPFLALDHPELIHSMTLVSSTYTFDDQCKTMARDIRASVDKEWVDILKNLHGETHGTDYAETILDLWLNSVLRPNELPFNPDDLHHISCPTLILHGDRDDFFPVNVPTTMYQSIPNSELCILPNCGHNPMLKYPSIFVNTLLEFLTRNPIDDSNQ